MSPITWSIDRSRTIILSLVFLLLSGVLSYQGIPKESAPDVQIPIIFISLRDEGVSPEDAERLLVRPVEQRVRTIEGVKEVRSTAFENGGTVTLEFTAGFDVDRAMADVRAKVDEAVPDLPETTDEPIIREVDFSLFPVLTLNLSGSVPEAALYRIARQLRDSIEEDVSEVLEARLVGDREESAEIIIDPAKIEQYGITLNQAIDLFQRNNALIPAGTLDTGRGRFPIKIRGLITTVEDMLQAPLGSVDDRVVRLRDVAQVKRTFKDPTGFARLNGVPSVAVEVSKRVGENIIETIDAVKDIVAREQKFWPENLQVTITSDESVDVKNLLGDLENNVIAAVILVMIVIVVSLGWRSSILVGVAVPGSFLIGILVIALQGFTINIVVLFSLILSVGMLVDGAIIVAEYADQQMRRGVPPEVAFEEASKRMTWPVITSIVTIIAAFLPLLFWPGIVGQFMKFLPITLIATLTASIIMALIFLPTLGAKFGRAPATADASNNKTRGLPRYQKLYKQILERALKNPGRVLASVFGLMVVVFVSYGFFGRGVEFFPKIEPDKAVLQVRAQGNLSVYEKDALVKKVETVLEDFKELKYIYTNTSVGPGLNEGRDIAEDAIALINLGFVDWQERRKAGTIIEEILAATSRVPGVKILLDEEQQGPPTGKPIVLELSSKNPALLLEAVKTARAFVDQMSGLRSIEDTSPKPGFEYVIEIDRERAAAYGADILTLGSIIQLASNGLIIDQYRPDDTREEVDILVRYPEAFRTLDQMKNTFIQTPRGTVPIDTFTTQGLKPKVDIIRRVDGVRVFQITADVQEGVLGSTKVNELEAWLSKAFPADGPVRFVFKGEDEDQKETSAFLEVALLITLFLILIILVTQFNSFYSAGVVLSAVLLSTIGVLIGLMVTGRPFNIVMGGIGVIALAGIIVSNNIILIDTFDQLRKTSSNIKEAIITTGVERIRPVLLTQITTVLGLIPMSLNLNLNFFEGLITYDAPSSQWWVDLSRAIVFGVTFATGLTLIVTPCALMVRENFRSALTAESLWSRLQRKIKTLR